MAESIINEAMKFAVDKHAAQKYGKKPYHVHLFDVVNVLRRFIDWEELPQALIDAAWLHDVVEDTDTPLFEIERVFGREVHDLVRAVTNEAGINRAERHAKTYPKIRETEGAIVLKLADRIANIEQSISHDRVGRPPSKLFGMYAKEWQSFQNELRGKCKGENENAKLMWKYLDGLMADGFRKEKQFKEFKEFKTFNGVVPEKPIVRPDGSIAWQNKE